MAKEWTHCLSEQQANNNMNGSEKNNGDSNNVKQQQKQQSKKRRLDDDTDTNGNNQLLLRNKENTNNTNAVYERESQIIQTALERAFLLTDIQSRMDGITTSGATVVCCVVIPKFDNGKLSAITIHAANAGDARAVLSSTKARLANNTNKQGKSMSSKQSLPNPELPNELPITRTKAVRITHDHKSTDKKEVERIENAGGIMIRGRVLGVLAVARSLGDHGLKEYVIARPYLSSTVVQIEGSGAKDETAVQQHDKSDDQQSSPYTENEFLIVACDGLWDVMEDQEVCDIVRSYVHENGSESRERVSSVLVQEALKRGSTDNITVIVYWL